MSLICGCVQTRTKKNWGAAPLCILCQNEIVVKIYRRIPFSWFTGHPKAILLNGVNVKDIHAFLFFLLFSSWTLVLARWASPAAAAASRFMPSGKVSLLLEELNLISHPGVSLHKPKPISRRRPCTQQCHAIHLARYIENSSDCKLLLEQFLPGTESLLHRLLLLFATGSERHNLRSPSNRFPIAFRDSFVLRSLLERQ